MPVVAMRTAFEAGEGVEDFIDAAVLVSWAEPAVRFLIIARRPAVGPSLLRARQRILDRVERVRVQDRVLMVEGLDDEAAVLSRCSVGVVPSAAEHHSRECRPWIAAGVPVVAVRTRGTAEEIRDGENGVLVPAGDPQDLATEIVRLLRTPSFGRRVADQAGRRASDGKPVLRYG